MDQNLRARGVGFVATGRPSPGASGRTLSIGLVQTPSVNEWEDGGPPCVVREEEEGLHPLGVGVGLHPFADTPSHDQRRVSNHQTRARTRDLCVGGQVVVENGVLWPCLWDCFRRAAGAARRQQWTSHRQGKRQTAKKQSVHVDLLTSSRHKWRHNGPEKRQFIIVLPTP